MTLSVGAVNSLVRRLGAVVSKRSGVALGVWGEPGVGKTFTLQGVLREVSCRSASLHATTSNPVLVRTLPRPKNLPVWAERFAGSLEQGGQAEPQALADVLSAWLAALAPFVLCIEDLHEAVPERLSMWTNLAEAVRRTRGVGLIVTSRTAPPHPFEPHLIEPLPVPEATALLEAEAGSPLPSEALAWVASQARGNPLFTLEYFRHLTRLGYLWSDGQRWRWRVPERASMPTSIEAIIGHHLDTVGVSRETRTALAARAMLPSEVDDGFWAEVAALSPAALRAARDELERGGILHAGAFAHPLYREVMRADLPESERRSIARRAIDALRTHDPVAAAGFVADAALEDDDVRALHEDAIKVARQAGHDGQVARLLVQIAARSERAKRLDLMLEAARLMRGVNIEDALEIAQAALDLDAKGTETAWIEAALLSAELLASLGRGNEAQRLLERVRRGYGRDASDGIFEACIFETRIFETQVRVKHLSHDYAGVLELWQEHAAHHARIALPVIARAYLQLWRLEEAEAIIAGALEAPNISNLEQAELRYIRSIIPYYQGNYAEAEVGYSALLNSLETLSDGSPRFGEMMAGTLQLRAYIRNVLGWPREALEDATAALALSARFGNAGYYAHVQSELGLYLLECGDYRSAEDVILEARATLERVGNAIYLSVVERIAARLYLEWAPPHGAALGLKHARAALGYIEQANRPPFYADGALFIAAWAEALHGRAEEALGLVAELETLANTLGQAGVRAGAAWVRGFALERLGQSKPARYAFEVALEARIPMQLGPTLERMALELDRVSGDLESARLRAERFRTQGALGALYVAQRHFPQLEAPQAVPANAPSNAPTVRLEVLGLTQVSVGGALLSDRTKKGKALLSALCDARIAGRREVSDLVLFDALYPELPEDKAASALKQLVYRLRSTFGANTIVRTGHGYALGTVESDAEAFLQTGDSSLWRGPCLTELGTDWGSSARDALHYALRKRALELSTSDSLEAARLGRILLDSDPFDREALELSLRALRESGDDQSAVRLYAWARAQYAEVGEVLPTSAFT